MYFYSSASPDAPKLKNNWGDFNTLINYIIDGGSNYKILKIEPNPEKENTVKVYYEESIVGIPFVQFQSIVISGSAISAYNTQMFIESVNSQNKYYVCYNSNLNSTFGIDESTNITMKIKNAGFTRKFGGVDDKRTVIKFAGGMEFRLDDRDWRPLVTPDITPDTTNDNWLKFTRISMSNNYDSLDSSNARMYPYDPLEPLLNFRPEGKRIGTQSYIQWNRVDTMYYPTQSTYDTPNKIMYSIFADEKSILIALFNENNQGEKFVYSFGEYDSYNINVISGFLYCKADTNYGRSDYDSSDFSTNHPYNIQSQFLYNYDSANNSDSFYKVNSTCVLFDNGFGNISNMVVSPEFIFSPLTSGNRDRKSLLNVNSINGGTYFCDVVLSDNAPEGSKQIYGKLRNMKWVCTNMTGQNNIDGIIFKIDNEYHYSYTHTCDTPSSTNSTNLIKLTRK